MRIIKSNLYMRKEAIWSKTPVGDPGLPGQLTEQDIVGGPDEDIAYGQQGELEIGNSIIPYTYDYDYNSNEAINNEPSTLMTQYGDQIRRDIELLEEDAKIQKQPGYGQQEYDPVDEYESIGF